MSKPESPIDVSPARGKALAKAALELAAITVLYVAVAKLSLTFASVNPSATPIWPTTGYALAAVLLLGYRIWPALFIGAFVVNVLTAGSFYTSLGIGAGNTLEAIVAGYILNRWADGRNAFGTPSGVAKFTLVCFASGTVISATMGVGSLSLGGYAPWRDFGSIWTTWWMGDSTGALVITPAIVLWMTEAGRKLERRELTQSALVYGAAIAVGFIAFSPIFAQTPPRTPLAFLAVLPLMWAALRRNQRDTAITALILSGFAVWGNCVGHGTVLAWKSQRFAAASARLHDQHHGSGPRLERGSRHTQTP